MNDIRADLLIDRRVYRIRSRNLIVGAWNAPAKGFIGIREKFGTESLFTEYEWDLVGAPLGTARAIEDLGVDVPGRIKMVEYLREDEGLRTNGPLFDLLRPLDVQAAARFAEEWRAETERLAAIEAALTPEERAARDAEREAKVQAVRDEFKRRREARG